MSVYLICHILYAISCDTTGSNNKNAAEVDIAPASGKIINNVKYRSRALHQDVQLKGMSRTITMQGFTFTASLCADKIKL